MIRLFRFLKPYRGYITIVLVLAALQSLANLYLPNLIADIIDNGIVKNDTGYILRVGGVMLLITLGGAICAIVGAYFASKSAVGFGRIIRAEALHPRRAVLAARVRQLRHRLADHAHDQRHHPGAAGDGDHADA